MPCFSPLKGYRGRDVGKSGKRPIVFNPNKGYRDLPVSVPCGQCRGCKLERSRQWAIRCAHEASLNVANSFITLTYNAENLPIDGSLNLRHFQLFMKRLREKLGKVRFYHCGEYGEQNRRPHYHACLFGLDFEDKEIHTIRKDIRLYKSKILSELWPYGFSTTGDVTFESAAYVARYITKKITGPPAADHYQHINSETGEISSLKPEYTTMSRRPGIGRAWYEKFKDDVYPDDFVIMRGKKMKPPKYYDRILEETHNEYYGTLKAKRVREAKKHKENNTPERLKVREKVLEARMSRLPRTYEEGT